ncbi:MAG: hypothetical protein AAGA20_16750 [Planctomycetota bacterium]
MDPTPADPHASAPVPETSRVLQVDAAVGIAAKLVYVTTGPQASRRMGEDVMQVALTPVVAARIAEILKVVLQYADLIQRQEIVAAWSAGEATQFPQGRVEVDLLCVRIGIEPLGAGARVVVLWEHVPALVLQLESCVAVVGP